MLATNVPVPDHLPEKVAVYTDWEYAPFVQALVDPLSVNFTL